MKEENKSIKIIQVLLTISILFATIVRVFLERFGFGQKALDLQIQWFFMV